MAKKRNKKSGIVFSTDPDYEYGYDEDIVVETLPPQQQDLRISRQRLKGNKMVTKVYQFVGTDDDLKDLGKTLKQKCGCGGSVKEGEILLQGDFVEKVKNELSKMGYKSKQSGG
ncbi:MAG: translation initiation factor [Bacteroidota bacterium]